MPQKTSYILLRNYALKISYILEWSLIWPATTTLKIPSLPDKQTRSHSEKLLIFQPRKKSCYLSGDGFFWPQAPKTKTLVTFSKKKFFPHFGMTADSHTLEWLFIKCRI